MDSFSFDITILSLYFIKEPSFCFMGAPFFVPTPRIKTFIFASFAYSISFVKSSLSPPSVIKSRYFCGFFMFLSTVCNIDKKSVPFSVMKFVSKFESKNPTASWSKLIGERRYEFLAKATTPTLSSKLSLKNSIAFCFANFNLLG